MKSWNSALEDCAIRQVRPGTPPSLVRAGLAYMITADDVQELRTALAIGRLPPDFEAKLTKLGEGSLIERYVEQNSRLFCALLQAALRSSFSSLTASDRERLLRVLAYVREDDDAIPDYLPGGYMDDQQEVRAAAMEVGPLLHAFKVWRLRYQVPDMWRRQA